MLKQLLILSLFLFPILAQANTPLNQSYIEQHRQIAVNEMQWSGIPASIKLAQAILESSWGRSKAATIYNSHFGIKCKDWQGDTFRKKDDDYDTYGNLIESCFRAYTSTEQSFRDHSNFLLTGNRYQELFTYDRSDYVNWAIGLQRCGYATDPEYALRLIDLIEKYKLYEYDGYKMASTATAMQPIAPRVNTPGATTVPQQHDRYHA
ncbi:MAG: glucosaminidase domain-containing protein, partial [Bacteroidota bacterium]